ncbi:hypothetical protein SmJEL517_g05434 [Synchytrium microbalum]|uniref:Response regulatory domain-containing protein n=1 Tax=Synchytrium microbalum TaxID=1806994 RepID=A0A507BUE9_9FUNG|nr:uncharacterized protein SmJEL517_g05434 [Synchytrium microbalum]TPX31182.1 hypothetical protein SmJEL517_g05434 [Synchytrium microbalum]
METKELNGEEYSLASPSTPILLHPPPAAAKNANTFLIGLSSLALKIAALNVVLQLILLMKARQDAVDVSFWWKLLALWHGIVLCIAVIVLKQRREDPTPSHIAVMLGTYVVVAALLVPRTEGFPASQTYIHGTYFAQAINLPMLPGFWMALGGLAYSVDRLLQTSSFTVFGPSASYLNDMAQTTAVASRNTSPTSSQPSSPATIFPSRKMIPSKNHPYIPFSLDHNTAVIRSDMQHNLASMRAIVSHMKNHLGSTTNSQYDSPTARVSDALTTCLANLNYVVAQFQSPNELDAADKGPERNKVLFDPSDLTEQVADSISYYADSKEVELIVHTPVGRTAEWYLTNDDPVPIRAILIKLISEVAMKAETHSHIAISLNVDLPSAIRSGASLTTARTFVMHCVWQIIYMCARTEPLEIEFSSTSTTFLGNIGGTHHHTANGDMCTEELRLDMDAVPLDNSVENAVMLDQFLSPLEKRELWAFSRRLTGARFALITTRDSQFVLNLLQYLENWGGTVTHGFTSNWGSLRATIDDFDHKSENERVASENSAAVFIDDDLAVLDTVIKRRLARRRRGCPIIYVCNTSNEKFVAEFEQAVRRQYHSGLPVICVISKPAGPRKILSTLKRVLFVQSPPRTTDDQDFQFLSSAASASRLGSSSEDNGVAGGNSSGSGGGRDGRRESGGSATIHPIGEIRLLPRRASDVSSRAASQSSSAASASGGGSPRPQPQGVLLQQQGGPSSQHPSQEQQSRSQHSQRPPQSSASSRHEQRAWTNVPASVNASVATPLAEVPVAPRISVLIVEDNIINQRILSTYLRHRGIDNVVANNGREAVDLWIAQKFHLVLMGKCPLYIMMPVMDGIEATTEIRRIEQERRNEQIDSNEIPPPETVIVALTASALPTDRDRALAAGCNDYLVKPVTLSWLERKIIEWGSMQALIEFGKDFTETAPRVPAVTESYPHDINVPSP